MTCFAANAAMRPKSSGVALLLADDGALLVEERHEDGDVAGLAVELGAGALGQLARGRGVLGVGGQDRLLDDPHEFVEGDLLLALDRPQQSEIDVHAGLHIQLSPARPAAGTLQRYRMPRR